MTLTADLQDLQRLRAQVAADDTSVRLAQIDAQIAEVHRQQAAEREAERLAALAVAQVAEAEAQESAFQATAALLEALTVLRSKREAVAALGGPPVSWNQQFFATIHTLVQKQQTPVEPEPQSLPAGPSSVWDRVVQSTGAMMALCVCQAKSDPGDRRKVSHLGCRNSVCAWN